MQGARSDTRLRTVNSGVNNFGLMGFPVFLKIGKLLHLLVVQRDCSNLIGNLKEIFVQSFKNTLGQGDFVNNRVPIIG
jgi:hypothetical protein